MKRVHFYIYRLRFVFITVILKGIIVSLRKIKPGHDKKRVETEEH